MRDQTAEVAFNRYLLANNLAPSNSSLNRAANLATDITAFEEWQQSDDSDGFPAIHVAYLLSREPKTPKAED